MEYHRTKDILYVKELLGHRDIKTKLIYTQLVSFESDEFHSATAKSVDEACKVLNTSFPMRTLGCLENASSREPLNTPKAP